jgi:hypothetical protein
VRITNHTDSPLIAPSDNNSFLGLDDVGVTPVPVPILQIASGTNGTFEINCPALAGLRYQLQYKTNLISANWINLGDAVLATNGTLTLSDTNGIAEPTEKFYRIILSQ